MQTILNAYNDEMNKTGDNDQNFSKRGLTRRTLASLLALVPLTPAVAATQIATTPQNPPPLTAPPPSTPEQRLAKAVDDVRQTSDRLAQTEVPMGIEPAFSFHV